MGVPSKKAIFNESAIIYGSTKSERFACNMSHVICPLCGKSVAVNHYDPSKFDDDVMGQSFTGKGRGKGFEVSDKSSVLGEGEYDNLLRMMASRALRIVKLLYDNGYLERKEIIDTLA